MARFAAMRRFQGVYRLFGANSARGGFPAQSRSSYRALATLSDAQLSPPPKGYDIDPILLKKVFRGELASNISVSERTEGANWASFRFPQSADFLVEPNMAAQVIKNIKYERVKLEHTDRASGYLNFAENYLAELNELRAFVRKSYDKKITEFSQLTSVELSNCVYIFKDAIARGSITEGKASYKKMAKTLLKFLTNDQRFTKALSHDLIPAVGTDSAIVDLYAKGITRYEKHLRKVSETVDFHTASLGAVIGAVAARIASLETELQNTAEENIAEDFFNNLIDLHRYQRLAALLSETQASSMDLWSIIEDPDLKLIDTSLWTLSGKENVLSEYIGSYHGRLGFVSSSSFADTTDDAHFLCSLFYNSADTPTMVHEARENAINLSVLQALLPMACSGIEHICQKIHNSVKSLSQPFTNIREYELFALYELNLFQHQDALRHFKGVFVPDDSLSSYTPGEIVDMFAATEELTGGNSMVGRILGELQGGLSEFFEWVDWETSILDDFIEKPLELFLADLKDDFPIEYDEESFDLEFLMSLGELLHSFREKNLNGVPFGCFLRTEILFALDEQFNKASGVRTAITEANEDDYGHLMDNLEVFFLEFHGMPSTLDLFAESEDSGKGEVAKAASTPVAKEYVQIPDDLEVQSFSKELESFREKELKTLYQETSAENILSLMDRRIDEAYNGLSVPESTSAITKENLYKFMKLSKKLTRLFELNNGHTQILDTVILNDSAFASLEKKLRNKAPVEKPAEKESVPYLQVPDDFLLEEFSAELGQLKSELSGDFKGFSAHEVSSKLREMAENEKKYNLGKRIAFSKLYRNLARLFNHNGNQTFVLDNVLLNNEVFNQFEANKGWQSTSVMDGIRQFFNGNLEILNQVGTEMATGISAPDAVLEVVASKAGTEEEAGADYFKKEYERTRQQIEGFDDLLKEVFAKGDATLMSLSDLNKAYELISPSGFQPLNFQEEEKDFFKALLKEENNPQFEPVEAEIKDALSIALSETENKNPEFEKVNETETSTPELDELKHLTAEDVRANYTKLLSEEGEVGRSTLKSYSKEAKEGQAPTTDRGIRGKKAYEWSRNVSKFGQADRHRPNFFAGHRNGSRLNLLFPGHRSGVQYMLLTLDGKTVLSLQNPLGESHVAQDMVTVLNQFSKGELATVWRQMGNLQRKQWTLIGGGGEPEKMLVFARVGSDRPGVFFGMLKSIFAATGAVFLVLFGINLWLNEYEPPSAVEGGILEEESAPVEAYEAVSESVPVPVQPGAASVPEKHFWKSLFWK